MLFTWNPKEHVRLLGHLARWLLIALGLGLLVGSACAFFLASLDQVTCWRLEQPWLLWLLPVAGVGIVWVYQRLGDRSIQGNNLLIDCWHEPREFVGPPRRMGVLVLIGTLATHLLGGSAGREGTAVQMGGSVAQAFGPCVRITSPTDRRLLLLAGVAAGFGGVFGTPLTGAIFAMEFLAIGRISYEAVWPCLIASISSDWACQAWGIRHGEYQVATLRESWSGHIAQLDWLLLGKVVLAAMLFGLAARGFADLTHGLGWSLKKLVRWPLLHPVIGGLAVIGLVYALGTRDFLGIGTIAAGPETLTIARCFQADFPVAWNSWLWKLLFTAITLAAGFKGGEVTPLFFIGAALGHWVAGPLNAPVDLMAAMGFVAVFASATNTPLACTIMGVELFGPHHVVYLAIACFTAYFISGHTGIYHSQRIGVGKSPWTLPSTVTRLGDLHHHPDHRGLLKRLWEKLGPGDRTR